MVAGLGLAEFGGRVAPSARGAEVAPTAVVAGVDRKAPGLGQCGDDTKRFQHAMAHIVGGKPVEPGDVDAGVVIQPDAEQFDRLPRKQCVDRNLQRATR